MTVGRLLVSIGLALGFGLGAGLLAAQTLGAPDLSARVLACGTCHGLDGNAAIPEVPSLAGQPVVFLENQMVMIREGIRDITMMKGLLHGMSDTEIGGLARHYAKLPIKSSAGARSAVLFARGEQLAQQNRCGSCHLPNYAGREQMPRLAAQREDFLLHSMRQFATNRANGRDTLMAASLYGLSDADLVALAHFLARTGP